MSRSELLPGYAAFRLGETRPFHWGWRHTTAVATLLLVSLTIAGTHGLLP